MISWVHAGPSIVASFLASMVEFVEALTVMLAIGSIRGWRSTLTGAAVAMVVLIALVVVLGQSLLQVPLVAVRLLVGTLALLFGARWLRKAVLRATGAIALRDEQAVFEKQTAALREIRSTGRTSWDPVALAASFKIVMLEGMEVVFIVIALGASSRQMGPALAGAAGALVLVCALGVALHRPLAHVPENTLKYVVGILLSAFGTFWAGEGLGLAWPAGDLAILALAGGYLLVSQALIFACRLFRARMPSPTPMTRAAAATAAAPPRPALMRVWREVLGLFVDDGLLAAGILVWIAALGMLENVAAIDAVHSPGVLFAGVAALLVLSAGRAALRQPRV
jgi:Ca2+/H+ antiporter, TMEM165/GDT1 family